MWTSSFSYEKAVLCSSNVLSALTFWLMPSTLLEITFISSFLLDGSHSSFLFSFVRWKVSLFSPVTLRVYELSLRTKKITIEELGRVIVSLLFQRTVMDIIPYCFSLCLSFFFFLFFLLTLVFISLLPLSTIFFLFQVVSSILPLF